MLTFPQNGGNRAFRNFKISKFSVGREDTIEHPLLKTWICASIGLT